jgi:hypothetical protein
MAETDYIEAPPTGDYLRSLVNDRLDWRIALGEPIDNALDANARRVLIEIGASKSGRPPFVRIEDDGDGCADLIDMVRLGKHTDHKTTLLGRYGIGAKNAMLWLGGMESTARVKSTASTVTRRLECVWKEYAERWRISREKLDEHEADAGARGTIIDVRPCIRRFPDGKALDSLVDDLGYNYSWAIKRGTQIQLRVGRREPIVLRCWELPPLIDVVDTQINVGGRGARVHVGIVKDGPNPRPGITYVHGFRVIKPSCALGCGGADYSTVCGFVELDRSWHLTKNKDDVSQHKEELGEAVYAVLRELLSKAEARNHQIQFSQFDADAQAALSNLLDDANGKGRRNRGASRGAKDPRNTGRKQRRATNEQDGKTFRRASKPLVLAYRDLGDTERLGQYSENCIVLNLGNPFVAKVRGANLQAVVLAAAFVLIEGVRSESANGQRKLRFDPSGEMTRDVGRLLAHPIGMDGASVHAEAAE